MNPTRLVQVKSYRAPANPLALSGTKESLWSASSSTPHPRLDYRVIAFEQRTLQGGGGGLRIA
jgi:hypothetical protein